MRIALLTALVALMTACGGSTPPPVVQSDLPPPPSGPTRTDFKTIARRLVSRCVGGGWIERWRSTHEDADVAKPRVFLAAFADETGQDLDSEYLRSTLEQRMRLSGVYDMVARASDADFVARGVLRRLAEREGGERISVYNASVDLEDAESGRRAHRCESTVRGEM
ncbi:MAG: hypothetical protein AAFU79_13945 [Myxococcota bacterium]